MCSDPGLCKWIHVPVLLSGSDETKGRLKPLPQQSVHRRGAVTKPDWSVFWSRPFTEGSYRDLYSIWVRLPLIIFIINKSAYYFHHWLWQLWASTCEVQEDWLNAARRLLDARLRTQLSSNMAVSVITCKHHWWGHSLPDIRPNLVSIFSVTLLHGFLWGGGVYFH